MRRLAPRALLLAAIFAGGVPLAALGEEPSAASTLPCPPGVIRPRPTVPPPRAPSPELVERQREVAAFRRAVEKYRDRVDDAVATAWKREREAVRRKFLTRLLPVEENERARRSEAIAELRSFLEKRAGGVAEAEVDFRLAELLFEEASDEHLVAMRAHDLDAGKTGGVALTKKPRPDYSEAIAAWRRLVRSYPDYARRDAVLYMIAFCLAEQGDAKAARDVYQELAELPVTSYRAEAWLRVGEYHFDQEQHDAAIDAYRKAAAAEEKGPYFDKALYKLAWSLYRRAGRTRGDAPAWAESADVFARLVESSPDSPLRPEALQYLAIIYADHGGLPAVRVAVAGKPWGLEVLSTLGALWYEQGNFADASQTYELVLERAGDHDDAPLWMNRLAFSYERTGQEEEAASARQNLHERYGAGSVWQAQKAAAPAVVAAADSFAEPALLQAATFRHQQAQWNRSEATYAHAARLYGEYLSRYPARPVAYDIAFYRAECLYFAGKLEEAAEAYGTVLEFTTEGPWHAEAAFSRFKAREGIAGTFYLSAEPLAGSAGNPLPDAMAKLVKAAEDFTCVAPTDWRVPEALFRAAQVLYVHGRLDAARERAEAVVKAAPREDVAAYAATMVVDTWRLESRWDRVEDAANRYTALGPGRSPATVKGTKEALSRVAIEAGFQVARQQEQRGDLEGAAKRWLSVAERAPGVGAPTLKPKALFAAADALERAGRSAQAAKTFGEVATGHRGDPLAEPAAFRRAANLARVLEVQTAAQAYAAFSREQAFSNDAPAASWNAALLLEAAGKPADAAAAYERFAAAGGSATAAERAIALFAAAESWEEAGRETAAARAFQKLGDSGDTPDALRVRSLVALARIARARKQKEARTLSDEAIQVQTELAAAKGGTAESARAAAEEGLAIAEAHYRRFESLTVAGRDPAKREAAIQAKSEALYRARDAFLVVAALGDPDGASQALHRAGEGYAALASAIRALGPPSGMTADEWRPEQEALAAPFEQHAIAALARNLEVAASVKVSTEWTRKSERLLARLSADRVSPKEDAFSAPDDDVWAIPPMLAPGALLAASGGASATELSRAIASSVDAYTEALRGGDLPGLRMVETALASVTAGITADAPAREAATAWHDLGVVRDTLGDRPGAVKAWRSALAADAGFAPAAAGLTAALARNDQPTAAIEHARAWLAKHPGDADVRVNLANALRLRRDAPAALAMAVEALSADSRDARARRAAIAAAIAAKRPRLAHYAARQGVELTPNDAETHLTLGLLRRSQGRSRPDLDDGRRILVAAAERFPGHARLAHAAGVALLEDGDPAAGRALLERAAPSSIDPSPWVALAAARRATNDAPAAAEAARRALALHPEDPAALRALGLALHDARDFGGAADAFERYLAATRGRRPASDPVRGWLDEVEKRARETPPPGGEGAGGPP